MLDPLKEEDPDRVGPFAIEARLGAGGSGRVYLGRAVDGTAAAVRVMPPGDPGLRDRFAALARVLGEHTAALVGADPEAEHPWLATEYVAGPPLTEVVAERGALPVPEVLRLTAGVAGALAALHAAGVVHRDLKPHNVLLAPAGPRVIDAGVARDERAGVPGDVLALGELITFLATAGTDPMPEALRALVARCTAPDPTDRPTAAEVRTLCDAALSGPPTLTAPAAEEVSVQDTIDALPHTAIVGPVPIPAPEGASGSDTEPSAPDTDAPDRDTAETTPAPPAPEIADPTADVTDSGHRTANITGPAPTEDIATEPPPDQPATNQPHPNAGKPDTTEPTPLAGATVLAHPTANPLDPAAGTPPTATVRPVVATGSERTAPDAQAPADTLGTAEQTPVAGATVLARPPANPLDRAAGIPSNAIVGPVVATEPSAPAPADTPDTTEQAPTEDVATGQPHDQPATTQPHPNAGKPDTAEQTPLAGATVLANPADGTPPTATVRPVVATERTAPAPADTPDTNGPAPAATEDIAPDSPSPDQPDATEPTPLAGATVLARPPANPLDLSAGIPSDAVVGPVVATGPESATDAAHPLAYPAASPPANPIDLSAGIPSDAIVGPVVATGPESATDAAHPLAYPSADPPANPIDLSAGIPSDAIVGPVPAPDESETPAITASLAYPPAQPPDNPLDLSAGIPPDAIVGPVPAPATENTTPTAADSLAYPAGSPPANPLDLSAGIPSDAIVGPVPAPENTEPPTALSAVPDTDTGPSDLTGGPVPGPGTEPGVPDAGPAEPHAVEHTGPVIEPIDYTTTPPRGFALRRRPATRPARHRKRNPSSPHRRLAGLAVALVLAVVALPLVRDSAIPGEPVAAPATSATPATEDQAAPGDTPGPNCAGSKDLRASGSSFQRDAMVGVADGWAARCPGSAFDYTPGGTALGLRQFGSGEADFAVTDHPLGEVQGEIAIAAARCAGTGASADKDLVFESPMVLTPIVLAYRLPGIPGLRLDATTVAAIFDGRVTAWNDKAIVTLNAGVRLPATKITVLSRTGKAQSTQTFQQYLTAVGGWRKGDGPEFAGGPSLAMPSDLTIMAAIRNIDGAIGYLPYSVTRPTDEPVAMIVTGNGKAAIPGSDAVHAAVAAALHASDDLDHLPDAIFRAGADQVGDGTAPYPLVHVGYVVACTRYPDDVRAAAVRDFLLVALATSAGPASGYELPSGDLRDRLVEFVERTY